MPVYNIIATEEALDTERLVILIVERRHTIREALDHGLVSERCKVSVAKNKYEMADILKDLCEDLPLKQINYSNLN